jgi:hypothetical protein
LVDTAVPLLLALLDELLLLLGDLLHVADEAIRLDG